MAMGRGRTGACKTQLSADIRYYHARRSCYLSERCPRPNRRMFCHQPLPTAVKNKWSSLDQAASLTDNRNHLSFLHLADRCEDRGTIHGRPEDYKELKPGNVAYYDGCVEIDLSEIKPMIAMPFHPSNTYTIDELKANLDDILADVEKRAQVSLDGKIPFTLRDAVVDAALLLSRGIIAAVQVGIREYAAADIPAMTNVYPAVPPMVKISNRRSCEKKIHLEANGSVSVIQPETS